MSFFIVHFMFLGMCKNKTSLWMNLWKKLNSFLSSSVSFVLDSVVKNLFHFLFIPDPIVCRNINQHERWYWTTRRKKNVWEKCRIIYCKSSVSDSVNNWTRLLKSLVRSKSNRGKDKSQAVCRGNERPRDTQTTRRWWGWETRERNATLVHPSIASLVLTNFVSHASLSLSSSESTVYTSQALNSQEGKLHPRKIKHLTFHNIYYKRQTAESLV